jgi:hypothetical protein
MIQIPKSAPTRKSLMMPLCEKQENGAKQSSQELQGVDVVDVSLTTDEIHPKLKQGIM